MFSLLPRGLLATISFSYGAMAACSSNLRIDDFTNMAEATNLLGVRASDDGSMTELTAAGNTLTMTPVPAKGTTLSPSYFYEQLPCLQAITEGYTALSFIVAGPSNDSSFTLELQSRTNCSDATFKQDWQVVEAVNMQPRVVQVPLSGWRTAVTNLDAMSTLVWATWTSTTDGQWVIGDVQLVCGDGSSGDQASSAKSTPSSVNGRPVTTSSVETSTVKTTTSPSSARPSTTTARSTMQDVGTPAPSSIKTSTQTKPSTILVPSADKSPIGTTTINPLSTFRTSPTTRAAALTTAANSMKTTTAAPTPTRAMTTTSAAPAPRKQTCWLWFLCF